MLSERELQILLLVAAGLSNRQIAGQLDISENTVKVHVRNIFAKINVASRTEASLYAVRHGLIDVPHRQPRSEEPAAQTLLTEGDHPLLQDATLLPPAVSSILPFARRNIGVAGRIGIGVSMVVALSVGYGVWVTQKAPPVTTTQSSNDARWHALPAIPLPRAHVLFAVANGQLYAMGGGDSATLQRRVDRYDSATHRWLPATDLPFAVGHGIGWSDGSGVWLLDAPKAGTIRHWDGVEWVTMTAQPVVGEVRQLVRWQGRCVVLVGGAHAAKIWIYDGTWTQLANLPPGVSLAAVVVNAEQLLAISQEGAVYAYDADKQTWNPDGELGQAWTDTVAYSVLGAMLVFSAGTPGSMNVYSPGQGVIGREVLPMFVHGSVQLVPWQMQLVIADSRGAAVVMYQALFQNFAPIAQ